MKKTPKKIVTKKNTSKWKPTVGDKYYFVVVMGGAYWESSTYAGKYQNEFNNVRIGNAYRTCDEAKRVAQKINAIFKANK